MADPTMYRERDEAEELGIKDPIDSLKNFMIQFEVADEGELAGIATKVDEEVSEAVQFAEDSPAPDLDAMYSNVYA